MIDEHSIDDDAMHRPDPQPQRRKYPWAILIVVAVFVIVPFISWYGTWFGRPLSDSKLEEYLNDREKPRNVQHALAQIANRIIDGDKSVEKWYPGVIAAAGSETPEVRLTAAWVMGQDNTREEFHAALRSLLEDPHPGVRHNAALALVRFGDASGRPELVRMLNPTRLQAPTAGTIEFILEEEGTPVATGAPLARIKGDDGQTSELHAPEDGRIDLLVVADGSRVEAGREVLVLSPSTDQVWEALRALYLVGRMEDIPHIERYARGVPGMGDRIQKQALAAIEAIRARKV
ncbi:MAG TPA: HEAT repeat domain-containing protein [Blastocatellia bacterium]|nr:HEAT repeat domain-containing protein [Blastocatellia bacterium]